MRLRRVFRTWYSPSYRRKVLRLKLWKERGQSFGFNAKDLETFPFFYLFLKDDTLIFDLGLLDYAGRKKAGHHLNSFYSIIEDCIEFRPGKNFEIKVFGDERLIFEETISFFDDSKVEIPWHGFTHGKIQIKPSFETKNTKPSFEDESFMLDYFVKNYYGFEQDVFYQDLYQQIYDLCEFDLDRLSYIRNNLCQRMERDCYQYRIKPLALFIKKAKELDREYLNTEELEIIRAESVIRCILGDARPFYHLQEKRGDPCPVGLLSSLKIIFKKAMRCL